MQAGQREFFDNERGRKYSRQLHTGEPTRGSPLPHSWNDGPSFSQNNRSAGSRRCKLLEKLTRSRGDAEDAREVLKLALRSLRSLRLKILCGLRELCVRFLLWQGTAASRADRWDSAGRWTRRRQAAAFPDASAHFEMLRLRIPHS